MSCPCTCPPLSDFFGRKQYVLSKYLAHLQSLCSIGFSVIFFMKLNEKKIGWVDLFIIFAWQGGTFLSNASAGNFMSNEEFKLVGGTVLCSAFECQLGHLFSLKKKLFSFFLKKNKKKKKQKGILQKLCITWYRAECLGRDTKRKLIFELIHEEKSIVTYLHILNRKHRYLQSHGF